MKHTATCFNCAAKCEIADIKGTLLGCPVVYDLDPDFMMDLGDDCEAGEVFTCGFYQIPLRAD